MKKPTFIAWSLGACLVVGVVAYRVGRARADGVPAMNPLYYGGVLNDGGRAVEGTRTVTVRLWDAATAGTTVCTTSAGATTFTGGRFRVALDATCVGAVRANPELWAEVQVEATVFPRAKLGAVPYALEAGRASAAAGALEARIAALEAIAHTRQVEYGSSGSSVTSTSSTPTSITVSGSTVSFTARSTAIYSLSTRCVIAGRAEVTFDFPSTPLPTNIRSLSGSANTTLIRDPCLNMNEGRLYTSAGVQAIVSLQADTRYTVQLAAFVQNRSCGSGTPFSSTDIQCAPIVITELN